MTQDTYLKIVKQVLASDPVIRIQASHQSKLNALGRRVARGECAPAETVSEITHIFSPFVGRVLQEALERALR